MDMFDPIPLDEAAGYFLRLRGGEKTASVEDTYIALAELSPEERMGAIKEAMAHGATAEDLAQFLALAIQPEIEKTAGLYLEKIAPGTHHAHSAGMLEALNQLPGRVFYSEFSKCANNVGMDGVPASPMPPPPSLSPTGMGKNPVAMPNPPMLSPTAMGHNKVAGPMDALKGMFGKATGAMAHAAPAMAQIHGNDVRQGAASVARAAGPGAAPPPTWSMSRPMPSSAVPAAAPAPQLASHPAQIHGLGPGDMAAGAPQGAPPAFFPRPSGQGPAAAVPTAQPAFFPRAGGRGPSAPTPTVPRAPIDPASLGAGARAPGAGSAQIVDPANDPIQQYLAAQRAKTAAADPKDRGHANAEADFEKRRHQKGEHAIGNLGSALGAAAGGIAGHHFGKHPSIAAAGVLAGYGVGRNLGKDVGHSIDEHRMKKHSEALKLALESMGLNAPPGDEPSLGEAPAHVGQSPGAKEDPLAEYMAQEQQGQAGETEGAAAYYQQKFQEAQQQLQQLQQQVEQSGQMSQQLQQQVAGSDEQIQAAMQQAQMAQQSAMSNVQQAAQMANDATNQALEFQSDALRQKQLAAAMRMGVQQMKDGVMSALAQDPTDQLAQQLQSPPPGSAGVAGGAPPAQPGAPAADPNGQPVDPNAAAAGGAPPGGAPADPNAAAAAPPTAEGGGGGESPPKPKEEKKDDDKGGTTKVEVKQAFSLPHAAVGGLAGGAIGAGMSQMSNDGLRQGLQELEETPANERGFAHAMQIATAKMRLAAGEVMQNHPGMTAAGGAVSGALLGGNRGPQMQADVSEIGRKMRGIYDNMKATG